MINSETEKTRRYPKPNGFPSEADEYKLRINFILLNTLKLLEFTKIQSPDWTPTTNQLLKLLYALYGIYFYDHVAGGPILSGHTTNNELAKRFRSLYLPHQSVLKTDQTPYDCHELSSWPVYLSPEKNAAPAAYPFGIISLPTCYFDDHNIDKLWCWYYTSKSGIDRFFRRFLSPNSGKQGEKSLIMNDWVWNILTGIEEAQHTHLDYLESVNYHASKNNIAPVGPLKSKISRTHYHRIKPFIRNHSIFYNTALGEEFAAHIVQAEYVRRYLPTIWESGYQEYDQLVRESRRQADGRTKRQRLPRPR